MNKKELKSQIEKFLQIPLKLLIILLILVAAVFFCDRVYETNEGVVIAGIVAVYCVLVMIVYFTQKPKILPKLSAYALEQGQVQRELLQELALPYVLMDTDGSILWFNKGFEDILGENPGITTIDKVFSSISLDMFPKSKEDVKEYSMSYEDRSYRVKFTMIHVDVDENASDEDRNMEDFDDFQENSMVIAYFFDETAYRKLQQDYTDQKFVASLVYIDNYEEALENVDEARRALLMGLVDRKISRSIGEMQGVIRKLEKDKYLAIFQQKYLAQLKAEKFELLDSIREINIGNELPVTISIAIGTGSSSFLQCYEDARLAMDMALGRGGDQAVIKEGDKINYYGGQNRLVEKNTRVKARVKAHALQGIIESKDKIVIMGHHFPDADAIGSAIGMYILANAYKKEAHICINEATVSIRPIMENFKNDSLYPEDMFINNEEAKAIVDSDTLLIVVDVNRPSYTECPELLNQTKTIVVLDHHRQGEEIISNAVLSYVEPYASSACEMISEVLQYTNKEIDLRPIEADAMYAGMMIDTGNFVQKTGSRTFEAAAYLKREGCDVVRVRKMFRDSMQARRSRAEAMRDAEVYRDVYAFAIFNTEGVDSPTVVASQVADDLLDVDGIGASFVLSDINGTIYISARSIDVINVQTIMERFDGGGHSNASGAQIPSGDPKSIIAQIKSILDEIDGVGDFYEPEEEDELVVDPSTVKDAIVMVESTKEG